MTAHTAFPAVPPRADLVPALEHAERMVRIYWLGRAADVIAAVVKAGRAVHPDDVEAAALDLRDACERLADDLDAYVEKNR